MQLDTLKPRPATFDPADAESRKSWAKIVVKAWFNPRFHEALLADPAGVCEMEGLRLPSGVTINLPPKPDRLGDIDNLGERLDHQALFCCCC